MEETNYEEQSNPNLALMMSSLKPFSGKIVVIKYGGNAMTEAKLKENFAEDIVKLHNAGIIPVVVHGGGPQISVALKRLSISEHFFQGIRVTDIPTMQVVEWVLCGEVQQELVRLINLASKKMQLHCLALGLSGSDGQLITAKKMDLSKINHEASLIKNGHASRTDIGQVGEVISVNLRAIQALQANNIIPVISSVASDLSGNPLNINADTLAGSIACELKADRLITMTNISGVLDHNKNLVSLLTPKIVDDLQSKNAFSGGILPKIQSALEAAKNGVKDVHIVDGRLPHALLKSFDQNHPIGTLVRGNS